MSVCWLIPPRLPLIPTPAALGLLASHTPLRPLFYCVFGLGRGATCSPSDATECDEPTAGGDTGPIGQLNCASSTPAPEPSPLAALRRIAYGGYPTSEQG